MLFRVTLERVERAVVYVEASDRDGAQVAAEASEPEEDYWNPERREAVGVCTIEESDAEELLTEGWGGEEDSYVENAQPNGTTVREWLERPL